MYTLPTGWQQIVCASLALDRKVCGEQVSASSNKKTNASARPSAAAVSETAVHKPVAQVTSTAAAVDLLGLDKGDAVGPSHKEGDEWAAFESFGGISVGRGAATTTAATHPTGHTQNYPALAVVKKGGRIRFVPSNWRRCTMLKRLT